eukprot:scaffold94088_cov43-Cyclotella_meneghiniana.AAC.1
MPLCKVVGSIANVSELEWTGPRHAKIPSHVPDSRISKKVLVFFYQSFPEGEWYSIQVISRPRIKN